MSDMKQEAGKAVGIGTAGAVVGAGAHALLGSVGLAFGGAAVGVTLVPFMAVGCGLALFGYGMYRLGRIGRKDRS
jgi:hypothetical protein